MSSILSPYEVDGTLSRYGSKMIRWKVGYVVNGLIFVCKIVALHALDSDVLEGLSVRLKRIGHYALRLVLNRVLNINLLVLEFSFSFRHSLPKLSDAALHVLNHLM